MKDYNLSKNYDLVSIKNVEADNIRNETRGAEYFEQCNSIIKSIHNKKKEFK